MTWMNCVILLTLLFTLNKFRASYIVFFVEFKHVFQANVLFLCETSREYRNRTFPANIYLFKVTIQTLEKGVEYVQSWQ